MGLVVIDLDSAKSVGGLFKIIVHELAHRISDLLRLSKDSMAVGEHGKIIREEEPSFTTGGHSHNAIIHGNWLFWKVLSIMYHYPSGYNLFSGNSGLGAYENDLYDYFFKFSWAKCDEYDPPGAIFVIERDRIEDLIGMSPKLYYIDYRPEFCHLLLDHNYKIIGIVGVEQMPPRVLIPNPYGRPVNVSEWFAELLVSNYELGIGAAIRYLIATHIENLSEEADTKGIVSDRFTMFSSKDLWLSEEDASVVYNNDFYHEVIRWVNKVGNWEKVPLSFGTVVMNPKTFKLDCVTSMNIPPRQRHTIITKARLNIELAAMDGYHWRYRRTGGEI